MKKLAACVLGLSLAASAAFAANSATSVNMVGFQNVSVPNGLVMISLNWNSVGGVSSAPINTLISGAGLTAGADFFTSDRIYVWDIALNAGAGGYKAYYLWNGDSLWYEFGNDALPTTNTVTRGKGFWLKHTGSTTNLTVSGEVPVGATNVVVFGAGKLNMIGSAYSADLSLNGANQTWVGNAGADFFTSDQIYIWDAALNAGAGGYKAYYQWNGDSLWYEFGNDALPTTNSIYMGHAAWFKNIGPSATTWTEVRPYTP